MQMASKMNAKLGLRKLKEQQAKKRIDHPLAKYNQVGQLSCLVCNVPLKSDLLWLPHLQSKKHKEAVSNVKSKEKVFTKPSSVASNINGSKSNASTKRKHDQTSKSIEELQERQSESGDVKKNSLNNAGLPADFFDQAGSTTESPSQSKPVIVETLNSQETKQDSSTSTSAGSKKISDLLPEGFFDDAKQDAKARKVEYINKQEEEWGEFQKMIAAETKVSEDIQAEEEEESKIEKDLSEYSALKQYVERVKKMKERRGNMTNDIRKKEENAPEDVVDNESSSEFEDEMDDILNWRAKKA